MSGRKSLKKEEFSSIHKRIVRKKAIDIFTDRVSYQEAFETMYNNYTKEIAMNNGSGLSIPILNFYGEGGIGKSLLSIKVIQELKKKGKEKGQYARYDFRISEPSVMEILRTISLSLAKKYNYKFPIFTLSLLMYQERTQKDLGVQINDIGEKINSNSVIGVIAALTKCFSTVGNFIELYQDIMSIINVNSSETKKKIITKIGIKNDPTGIGFVEEIIDNSNLYDLVQNFPKYFCYDMRTNLEKAKYPLTIFLDTYEHYIDPLRSSFEVSKDKDLWLRDENGVLACIPKVIWVISGRDKLSAISEEKDPYSWASFEPEEHLLDHLSEVDIIAYLNMVGITDYNLVKHIVASSEGVPILLDILYETYCSLLQKKGIKEAYNLSNYENSFEKIINRYLEICDIDTRALIKELSVIEGGWTDDLIEAIKPSLGHYEEFRYDNICDYSSSLITSKIENGITHYEMQKVPRQIILKNVTEKTKNRINRAILNYKTKVAKCPDNIEADISSIEAVNLANKIDIDEYQYFLANVRSELYSAINHYKLDKANEMLLKYENNKNLSINTNTNLFIRIISNRSYYWEQKGEYRKALECIKEFEELIDNKEVILDFDTESNYYIMLGVAYANMGLYKEALDIDERCYILFKNELGEDHPNTLISLNNWANDLSNIGNYEKAIELEKQCYILRKEKLGEDHSDTLDSLTNWANDLSNIGNYEKAMELKKQCYILRKEKLGENHPDTINSLNNLAYALYNIGDYKKASGFHERCYIQHKEKLGEDHPVTLASLSNWATDLSQLGNYAKVKELHERCYILYKKKFGESHPNTLASLNNLAVALSNIGNYEKARELHERCYILYKEKFGEDHTNTLASLSNWANDLSDIGNYEKARELRERCYILYKEKFGEDHTNTLASLSNWANALSKLSNYKKARELHERCYILSKEKLSEDHPDTIRALSNLARDFYSLGNYEKARELYERCYILRKEKLGGNHSDTLTSLNHLADALLNLGNYDEANKLFERNYILRKEKFGENNIKTIKVLSKYAESLSCMGDIEKGSELQEQCYNYFFSTVGLHNSYALDSMTQLISDYLTLSFLKKQLQ